MDFELGDVAMSVTLEPERVKAEIRIKCGTLVRFAGENGLAEHQVRDFLRHRSSTAKAAVAQLLGIDPDHLVLSRSVPVRGLDTASVDDAHGLCAEAK